MARRRALVIPVLAFLILLLAAGASPAYAGQTTNGPYVTGIEVTQTCASTAAVGDTITYVVTVINTGNEPLKGIKVFGPLLGDLGASFADNLDAGAQESHSFTRVLGADDPQPLESVITAKTEGFITDESENDTASCSTAVGPARAAAITVTKGCPPTATVGNVITYTIRVTNTGNEALGGVAVVDSLLGDLSASFPRRMEPGQSEERATTRTLVAADAGSLLNQVTALGAGVTSGTKVSSAASCRTTVTAVLGVKTLPATGAGMPGLAAVGFGFLLVGMALRTRSIESPQLILASVAGAFIRPVGGRSSWAWGPPPGWRVLGLTGPRAYRRPVPGSRSRGRNRTPAARRTGE